MASKRFGDLQIGHDIAVQRRDWLLVLVENGRPLREHMDKSRIDDEDILEEARQRQGLERMDQIKYAVLERNGGISIIPVHRTAPASTE